MQLLAVPFTPTYAEYIFLKGRRVLADQMEYLIAHFPALEPAARAHATLADVNAGVRPPPSRSGVVYHIDASYFIFRAYHSMPPDMVDGDGNATHALYGFARFLSDLLEQVRPERIGVAFDRLLAQRDLVPQRHLSRLQGQSRITARRFGSGNSRFAESFAGTWALPNSRARPTKRTTSSALWPPVRAPPACAMCW